MEQRERVMQLLREQFDLWNRFKQLNEEQKEVLLRLDEPLEEIPMFQEKDECIKAIFNGQELLDKAVELWLKEEPKSDNTMQFVQDRLMELGICQREVMEQNIEITNLVILHRKKIQDMRREMEGRKGAIQSYASSASSYGMNWMDEKK